MIETQRYLYSAICINSNEVCKSGNDFTMKETHRLPNSEKYFESLKNLRSMLGKIFSSLYNFSNFYRIFKRNTAGDYR